MAILKTTALKTVITECAFTNAKNLKVIENASLLNEYLNNCAVFIAAIDAPIDRKVAFVYDSARNIDGAFLSQSQVHDLFSQSREADHPWLGNAYAAAFHALAAANIISNNRPRETVDVYRAFQFALGL